MLQISMHISDNSDSFTIINLTYMYHVAKLSENSKNVK